MSERGIGYIAVALFGLFVGGLAGYLIGLDGNLAAGDRFIITAGLSLSAMIICIVLYPATKALEGLINVDPLDQYIKSKQQRPKGKPSPWGPPRKPNDKR